MLLLILLLVAASLKRELAGLKRNLGRTKSKDQVQRLKWGAKILNKD